MEHRVPRNSTVCLGTSQYTNCWIIALPLFQIINHSDIYIQLPDVLMRYLIGLKLYNDKAFLKSPTPLGYE